MSDRLSKFTRGNNRAASTRLRRRTRVICHNTYGLTSRELRHEIRRLTAAGWQTWELAQRFDCRPCAEQEAAA